MCKSAIREGLASKSLLDKILQLQNSLVTSLQALSNVESLGWKRGSLNDPHYVSSSREGGEWSSLFLMADKSLISLRRSLRHICAYKKRKRLKRLPGGLARRRKKRDPPPVQKRTKLEGIVRSTHRTVANSLSIRMRKWFARRMSKIKSTLADLRAYVEQQHVEARRGSGKLNPWGVLLANEGLMRSLLFPQEYRKLSLINPVYIYARFVWNKGEPFCFRYEPNDLVSQMIQAVGTNTWWEKALLELERSGNTAASRSLKEIQTLYLPGNRSRNARLSLMSSALNEFELWRKEEEMARARMVLYTFIGRLGNARKRTHSYPTMFMKGLLWKNNSCAVDTVVVLLINLSWQSLCHGWCSGAQWAESSIGAIVVAFIPWGNTNDAMVESDCARSTFLERIKKYASAEERRYDLWWKAERDGINPFMSFSELLAIGSRLLPGSMRAPSRRAKQSGRPFFLYTNLQCAGKIIDGRFFATKALEESIKEMNQLGNRQPEAYRGFIAYDIPRTLQNSFHGLNSCARLTGRHRGSTIYLYALPVAVIFYGREKHFSICFFKGPSSESKWSKFCEKVLSYDGMRNKGVFTEERWENILEREEHASQVIYKIYCERNY